MPIVSNLLFREVKPKIDFSFEDVECEATKMMMKFLLGDDVDRFATKTVQDAYESVLMCLYDSVQNIPPLRRIKIVTSTNLSIPAHASFDRDNAQGEIVMGSNYIYSYYQRHNKDLSIAKYEFEGVLRHELTHLAQYNGSQGDPADGGVIEGIADYVRLVTGFPARHWKEEPKVNYRWNQGYSETGYFLNWLEQEKLCGFVQKANMVLKTRSNGCQIVAKEELQMEIEELWKEYQQHLSSYK